jgi:hypothetical protein
MEKKENFEYLENLHQRHHLKFPVLQLAKTALGLM